MNIENDPIHVDSPKGIDPEKWLEYQERRRVHITNALVTLGFFAIVASTIILLVWSPWN